MSEKTVTDVNPNATSGDEVKGHEGACAAQTNGEVVAVDVFGCVYVNQESGADRRDVTCCQCRSRSHAISILVSEIFAFGSEGVATSFC